MVTVLVWLAVAVAIAVPLSAIWAARKPEVRFRALRFALLAPIAVLVLFLLLQAVGPRHAGGSAYHSVQNERLAGGGGSW